VHLLSYSEMRLAQLVRRIVHNTNKRRIVVVLPVDGPFLSVPRVILGRFDTHGFLRFGHCLLCKLIHDVLAEIDHRSN